MATYVLVGGAWLGAWAWREVARDLAGRGHDVHALTLTGLGDRAHLARPDVDLDTHIADVRAALAFEDLRDVVLVGHSYAGMVITGVADHEPQRIARLVYLDTGPLPSGQALLDFSPPEGRTQLERTVREHGDGWLLPPPPFEALGAPSALAGLTPAHRALMEARMTPQPYRTWTRSRWSTPSRTRRPTSASRSSPAASTSRPTRCAACWRRATPGSSSSRRRTGGSSAWTPGTGRCSRRRAS